jgi:hypothetical protein
MAKVFIIEPLKPTTDISSAKTWGDIELLFKPNERRCGVFQHTKFGLEVVTRLTLANFDPTVDYICVVGSNVVLSISLLAIFSKYDEFIVLLYNAADSCYVNRRIRRSDWQS